MSSFSRHLLPVLLLGIVTACALFLGLILHLVDRQNDIAGDERRHRALAIINNIAQTARYEVMNNAVWDEAARRSGPEIDLDWFQENLGADQYEVMNHGSALLLDGAGTLLGGAHEGVPITALPSEDVRTALASSLRAAARAPGQAVGAFLDFAGRPSYAGLAAICMHSEPGTCTGRFLAFVTPVEDLVRSAALSTGWSDLAVRRDAGEGPSLAIPAADGTNAAHLVWRAPTPGYVALRESAPLIGGALAIIGVSFFGLFARLRAATNRMMLAQAEAERLAHTDALTGLDNRRAAHLFLDRLRRERAPVALVSLDFDDFKEINDTLGHETGDALMVEMTARMARMVPQGGMLARLGGDEFTMICPRLGLSEAAELGHDLVMAIRQPVALTGQVVSISASVGVATSTRGTGSDELFRRADMAMFEAKSLRVGAVRTYAPGLDEAQRQSRDLDREMRTGLAAGEFHVVFQPILSVPHDRFGGVEALLRWQHPVRGFISPATFIPVAERSRFIVELGDFVLREACTRLAPRGDLNLSVNLSPVQLLDDRLAERVRAILSETGFDPARMELEVTEGYLVSQEERALRTLTRLREDIGVRISLDDFGSGYASIGYLRRFPLDRIKIDQSFVRPIENDPKAQRLLLSIISLCKAFEIPITAEGVETEAQAQFLRSAGCDNLQGFHFARPSAELPGQIAEDPRGAVA